MRILAHGGARPVRAGGFLLHHQSQDPRAQRAAVDRSGEPAHGRHDRGARRARVLPPPARPARGRPDRGGAARHPRDSGIEGARPPVVRLHVQRHLLGAAGGDRGAADGGAGAPRRGAEAEGAGGGRSGGGAYRRRRGPGGADPRRLGARRAQRQRAGRSRCGGGAARHLAGRAPVATAGRKSTGIAITCAPSTRSIMPAR